MTYNKVNSKECGSCSKSFLKEHGCFVSGKWFCCEAHSLEHVKKLREMEAKIKERMKE